MATFEFGRPSDARSTTVTRHYTLPVTSGDLEQRTDAEARRVRDQIFDQAPLGMVLVDTTGLLLRVNAAAAAIVGRDPSDLAGATLSQVVHPADCLGVSRQLDALVAGTITHLRAETRLVHGDGRVVWICVHASCVRDTDGTPQCVITQIEDITERRRSDAALAAAEESFRTTFEMAPIGMILTDAKGVVTRANPAFGVIVGRHPDALTGTMVLDITHPDDVQDQGAQVDALASGELATLSFEKRYLRPDGTVVWASVSASCVRDTSGNPLYLIGQIEDITERREMRERLTHAAIHDPLTDLPNRELFMDRLDMALRRARRGDHRVAVMFLDLDHFKKVNDSLGHEVGDELLRAVADRMKSTLRVSDTLARFGGDEFTILCDEVTDEAHILEIADRIRSSMQEPLVVAESERFISFSVGIALSTDADEDGSTLLRHADIAMYRAKRVGPARVEIYIDGDLHRVGSRLRTTTDLHDALERHEMELHYQPLVDLHTQTMMGIESVVRWQHPTRGLLMPDEFIPMAEDSGLIVPLGTWALEQSCRQAAAWAAAREGAGQDNFRLNTSVSVAALQLADPEFPDLVRTILDTTGMEPGRLWLRLTEGTLMRDPDATVEVLRTLHALGLHIGIDHFGTGFSSLAYLKRFPVEALKIDGSFVREVDRRAEDTAVVRTIIAMGDSLGLVVVAGGVERWDQVDRLKDLGCHLAQGHLMGRPLDADALGLFPTDDLNTWRDPALIASS
jgi:diguanylate cyclase (GGDEF)-like protein/PAS domain S-box-containing protein